MSKTGTRKAITKCKAQFFPHFAACTRPARLTLILKYMIAFEL